MPRMGLHSQMLVVKLNAAYIASLQMRSGQVLPGCGRKGVGSKRIELAVVVAVIIVPPGICPPVVRATIGPPGFIKAVESLTSLFV